MKGKCVWTISTFGARRSSTQAIFGEYRKPSDFDRYVTRGNRRFKGSYRLKYQTCTPSTSTGQLIGTSRSSSTFEFDVRTVTSWPLRTRVSATEDTEIIGPPIR